MSEPFFDFIHDSGSKISSQLYGFEAEEKRYERLDYVPLPRFSGEETKLVAALRSRRTERDLGSRGLSLGELSRLLSLSLAKDEANQGVKKYSFPSGGGFYPLETYLYIQNVDGLKPGIYHYSSVLNALALMGAREQISLEDVNAMYKTELQSMPPVMLFMTIIKSRIISKYGNLSYKLSFIEAGHRGQNLCLVAAASGLATCSLGGGESKEINELLGVDGVNEHHIYALGIGTPKI